MSNSPPSAPAGSPVPRYVVGAASLTLLLGLGAAYVASEVIGRDTGRLQVPEVRLSLPDFALTERSGRSVGLQDLAGSVWIADFVFTSCAGPCPQMTRHMRQLQDALSDVPRLRLVSFSVDPQRDTPQILQQYAERFGADPHRWLFLTGDLDDIYDLAIEGFKIAVEQARRDRQIIHDTRFIVVDAAGAVRGYYDSNSEDDLRRLRRRVRELAQDGR